MKTKAQHMAASAESRVAAETKAAREQAAIAALPDDVAYTSICVHGDASVSLTINFDSVARYESLYRGVELPVDIVAYVEGLAAKLPPLPRSLVEDGCVGTPVADKPVRDGAKVRPIGPVCITFDQSPEYGGDRVRIDWYSRLGGTLFHVNIELPPWKYSAVLGRGQCNVKRYAGGEVASADHARAYTPYKPWLVVHYRGGSRKDPGNVLVCLPPGISFASAVYPDTADRPDSGWDSRDSQFSRKNVD